MYVVLLQWRFFPRICKTEAPLVTYYNAYDSSVHEAELHNDHQSFVMNQGGG